MMPMVYTVYGFAIFFMIAWVCLWLIHIMALSYSKWKLHRTVDRSPPETPYPGVTILKPLTGTDLNLFSNLETFFTLDYPTYEICFCVETEHDAAVVVVNTLLHKYPHVDARLFTGGKHVGVNPKINNLQPGYLAAKYPLILISDAGIRMRDDTLLDMVQHMREDVAIVHQMPFAWDAEGFAAVYEKVFFGTAQARMYLGADLLGINCHTGMSSLVRRCALEEAGGLQAFADYLAEDYFMAKAVMAAGWKMRVSSLPALQNTGARSVGGLQARLARWARLRIAMVPTTALLEPLTECMPLGAGAAWAAGHLFNAEPLPFFLVHVLVWFLSDWLMLRSVQNGSPPFTKVQFLLGWVWSECCAPFVLAAALISPEISWRTRSYRLDWGGHAHELKPLKTDPVAFRI
ncbi:ceramide glucosyltransferase [Hyposmocoma kahamanoa]|uniref:ceramide glucosyltransferase n=1 Tax=Hyposmocoma kahamanoa TaxID=1477025 RepID=UPI000E6D91F2|nr:ceramide glucosyltransferase [Hyposmocoma kahamanoa]